MEEAWELAVVSDQEVPTSKGEKKLPTASTNDGFIGLIRKLGTANLIAALALLISFFTVGSSINSNKIAKRSNALAEQSLKQSNAAMELSQIRLNEIKNPIWKTEVIDGNVKFKDFANVSVVTSVTLYYPQNLRGRKLAAQNREFKIEDDKTLMGRSQSYLINPLGTPHMAYCNRAFGSYDLPFVVETLYFHNGSAKRQVSIYKSSVEIVLTPINLPEQSGVMGWDDVEFFGISDFYFDRHLHVTEEAPKVVTALWKEKLKKGTDRPIVEGFIEVGCVDHTYQPKPSPLSVQKKK